MITRKTTVAAVMRKMKQANALLTAVLRRRDFFYMLGHPMISTAGEVWASPPYISI
jgi:hypothetical protein